jgi:hypothetical protein
MSRKGMSQEEDYGIGVPANKGESEGKPRVTPKMFRRHDGFPVGSRSVQFICRNSIRSRQDNWVLVRYAKELNPGKRQSSLGEPTVMGFRGKGLQIVKCLCDHGTQSMRQLARRTGLAKSSVHRLTQAMERRDAHPESWLWETEEGRHMHTEEGRVTPVSACSPGSVQSVASPPAAVLRGRA